MLCLLWIVVFGLLCWCLSLWNGCEMVIEVVSVGWINVVSVINVIRKVIEYGVKIVFKM